MNFVTLLGKTTIVSVITSMITYLSYFYLSINAGKSDFGFYSYYQSIMLMLINILPFGTTMAVVVFRYQVGKEEYFNLIKFNIFIIMPLILILSSVIAFGLKFFDYIIVDGAILFSILIICFFNAISLVAINYYRVSQLFFKFGVLSIGYVLVNSVFLVVFYFYFVSFDIAFYLNSGLCFLYSLYCINSLNLNTELRELFKCFNKKLINSFKYGIPIVLSSLVMSFLIVGDRLLIGKFLPYSLPNYAAAALISSTFLFLVNNFASAWGGYLVRQCSPVNKNSLCLNFSSNSKKLWLAVPLFFIAITGQYVIYFFLYKMTFPKVFPVVLLLTLAYVTLGVSKFYIGYMNLLKRNLAVFFSSLLGVLILFVIVLFAESTMFKIAFAVFIGTFFQLVFCFFYTRKMLSLL